MFYGNKICGETVTHIFDLFSSSCNCSIRSIKIIQIARNTEEEMPLNLILKRWSKNFQLKCTKHVKKHKHILLCTYIMGKDMFELKIPNLKPNLYIYIYLKLVISKILSIY